MRYYRRLAFCWSAFFVRFRTRNEKFLLFPCGINFFIAIFVLRLRSKIGCISKMKINHVLFCILLDLHYLCTQKSAKSGGASAIEKHFIAFGFLRPDGSKRPKVERHRLCHQKSTETG